MLLSKEQIIILSILYASTTLEAEFLGCKIFGNGKIIGVSGKELKPEAVRRRNDSGFCYRVKLGNKRLRVHRVMAHVFYKMPLNSKKHVNHLNKQTDINALYNLRVETAKQNMRHRSADKGVT